MSEGERHPPEEVVRKERFQHRGGPVEVVEDDAFRERLKELREKSAALNKTLQEKLDEAGLPYYSWNKTSPERREARVAYPKVLRLAVLLRPEYFAGGASGELNSRRATEPDAIITNVVCHILWR